MGDASPSKAFSEGYWARVDAGAQPGEGESPYSYSASAPLAPPMETTEPVGDPLEPPKACLTGCPIGLNDLDFEGCMGPVEGKKRFPASLLGRTVVKCGGVSRLNKKGVVVPRRNLI